MDRLRNGLKINVYIFGIAAFVFACSSVKKEKQKLPALKQITLQRDLNISAGTSKEKIGSFQGLAVDKKGEMYVVDKKLTTIHVFSPDGHYLGSIGRKGKGPGEFASINSKLKIVNDTMYVQDRSQRRIDLINIRTRKWIRSFNIPNAKFKGTSLGAPRDMLPLPDGNILESFRLPYYSKPKKLTHQMTVALFNPTGNFIKKDFTQIPVLFPTDQALVHIQRASGQIRSVTVYNHLTFYPTTILTTDPKGHLFVGRTDSVSLNEYDNNGQLTGTIKGNSPIAKMTDNLKDSLLFKIPFTSNTYRKVIKKAGIPKHWPAWQNVLFDNKDRCYVELLNPGKKYQTWWIFNAHKKPEWKFTLPSEVTLYAVRNGEAYGIWSKKGQFQRLVRYHVKI
ncbi:MAG TPA: 6-bladed beta-propeller [Balneolales bacterium]|nr:6-bladed beta-propeller [Balneolales bacterium]